MGKLLDPLFCVLGCCVSFSLVAVAMTFYFFRNNQTFERAAVFLGYVLGLGLGWLWVCWNLWLVLVVGGFSFNWRIARFGFIGLAGKKKKITDFWSCMF